jgi:hypothetical protein
VTWKDPVRWSWHYNSQRCGDSEVVDVLPLPAESGEPLDCEVGSVSDHVELGCVYRVAVMAECGIACIRLLCN